MLYEMLAGETPFVAEDVFGFVTMHLKQQVIPLTHKVPKQDVPGGLDEVVLHMLEKNPGDRPSDAAVLADQVERWAVEDPRAAEKGRALRIGMAAVVGAGVVAAGAAVVLASDVGVAVAASALGLGAGTAAAARYMPRPSVFGYAQRLLLVAGACGLAGFASLLVPGNSGLFVTIAYALAAVLTYAAYLTVWSRRTLWPRLVSAGVVAPLLAAALLPVRVAPPATSPYFITLVTGASPDLAALEAAARQSALIGLVLLCVLFAVATLALPKPAAARI